MAHAWQRWKRKDPHNRVSRRRIRSENGRTIGYDRPTPLAEPPLCTVFSRKAQEKRFVDKKGICFKDGFLDNALVTDEPWIAKDYAAARTPVPQAADMHPFTTRLEKSTPCTRKHEPGLRSKT